MTTCEEIPAEQNILERVRQKDDAAFAALLEHFMPMIRQETSRFRQSGADEDDLAQEAALGLFSAARAYADDRGASFATFARVCVRRRLINAVRAVVSEEIPHESPFTASETEAELFSLSPDKFLLEREEEAALLERLKTLLSDTEYQVLILHMASYSYNEIAQVLQMTPKAVDNALQRIRRKLKNALQIDSGV